MALMEAVTAQQAISGGGSALFRSEDVLGKEDFPETVRYPIEASGSAQPNDERGVRGAVGSVQLVGATPKYERAPSVLHRRKHLYVSDHGRDVCG